MLEENFLKKNKQDLIFLLSSKGFKKKEKKGDET
jgi:hypothetical protein